MEYVGRTFRIQNQPDGGHAVHKVLSFDGADIFSEVGYPDLPNSTTEVQQMPLAQFVAQIATPGVEI